MCLFHPIMIRSLKILMNIYISLLLYNIFSSPHKYVCHSLNKYMMGKVVRLPVYIVFENVGLVICLDTGTCF